MKFSRLDSESRKVIFYSAFWGGAHGAVRLEHLFLALALLDVTAVRELQLPRGSVSLPTRNKWRKNPLVSKAFYKVIGEVLFKVKPEGDISPTDIAAAMRSFLRSEDHNLNNEYTRFLPSDLNKEDQLLMGHMGFLGTKCGMWGFSFFIQKPWRRN